MPSTDAPTWWADVQQEREDLVQTVPPGRRPAEDWLGEDIDFVPRRRMQRHAEVQDRLDAARTHASDDGDHPLHGVFVPTAARTTRTVEVTIDDDVPIAGVPASLAHELAHLSAADDPFASPPPPVGERRTVQIKGRPATPALPSSAQRHRGRTASDRVGPRPDRIALWAVALGALLILLAAITSSSQAAVRPAAHAPAAHVKVVHVAHHAPLRTVPRHP